MSHQYESSGRPSICPFFTVSAVLILHTNQVLSKLIYSYHSGSIPFRTDAWFSRGDSTDGPTQSVDDGRLLTLVMAGRRLRYGYSAPSRANRDGRNVVSSPDRDVAISALLLFFVHSFEEFQFVADQQCLVILVFHLKVLGHHAVVF